MSSTYLTIKSIDDLSQFRENFFWPVAESEKEAFMHKIVTACREVYLREEDVRRDQIIRAFLPLLAAHCFSVGYAAVLICRIRKERVKLENFHPSPIDFFSWLILDDRPLDYRLVQSYLQRYTHWRQWFMHGWRAFVPAVHDTRLLTLNITVEKFLKMNDIYATKTYLQEWFTPFSVKGSRWQYRNLGEEIFDTIWTVVGPQITPAKVKEWFFNFIVESVQCIDAQLDLLSKRAHAEKIKALYTATQGNILTRLISIAVLENGGEVFSFPHTGGLMYTVPQTWMIEPLTASTFYCYTEAERDIRERHMQAVDAKSRAKFQLLPAPASSMREHRVTHGRIRDILFLSGSYLGDRNFVDVLPEPVRFDLELKIIDALIDQGIDVIVKLHRKSKVIEHQKKLLQAYYGDRIVIDDTPLTDLLQKRITIDAFVSENLGGGSLVEVMKTDKPIILITPYLHLFPQEYVDMFQRRVYTIPCTFDDKNRANFSKEKLYEILNRGQHLIDYDHVNQMTNPLFAY